MNDYPFYSVEISAEGCAIEVLCNGFPVIRAQAPSRINHQYPVNHLLLGKNDLMVKVKPLPHATSCSLKGAWVEGSVRVFQKGDIVTPEDGEVILQFDLGDAIEAHGDSSEELSMRLGFRNRIHDFARLLRQSPVIEDEDSVRGYGMYLVNLFRRQDLTRIMAECRYMFPDYAKAAFEPVDALARGFEDSMRTNVFRQELRMARSIDEIVAVRVCDARLCELAVGLRRRPLVWTVPSPAGANFEMRVFVAIVANRYQVVRN